MASNFIQDGNVITLTSPSGGLLSGDARVIGNVFGVAAFDAAQTAPVEMVTVGVFELPKAAGAISQGARVWWDNALHVIKNASASGLFPVGVAVEAALDAGATVKVRFDGVGVVAV
jgi:predicted RecA/RadA family phage recombinase